MKLVYYSFRKYDDIDINWLLVYLDLNYSHKPNRIRGLGCRSRVYGARPILVSRRF